MLSRGRAIFYIVAISLASAITAMLLTIRFYSRWPDGDVALLSTSQYAELSELKRFRELSDLIEDRAFTPKTKEENYIAAAEGMIHGLDDRYAAYYTHEQYKRIEERQRGEYSGIGATIEFNPQTSEFSIVSLAENSAGAAAGVQVGDILTAVDGIDCAGMTQDELVAHVRGEEGTEVVLSIRRGASTLELTVKRAAIASERVMPRILANGVGVIRLTEFSSGDLVAEFNAAIESLKSEGMSALILDLRDNPGGNLETVVEIADIFLDGGTILTIRPREGDPDVRTAKPGKLGLPLAILINENSASASEVLAGAVQDHKVGTIVGTRSFGKGSVQTTYPLPEGGGWAKFTTAVYFTPSGRSVQDEGIVPDVEVALTTPAVGSNYEDIPPEQDQQLQAAARYLVENRK